MKIQVRNACFKIFNGEFNGIFRYFVGDNGRITFSIVSGNDLEAFEINEIGEIYTKTLLDREEIQLYNLNIKIEDNAKPATEKLSAMTQV